VLVFSRTTAYRHPSIPHATSVLRRLGKANGFAVDATEDPSRFSAKGLAPYAAVVWLLTTGDVLNTAQQRAFQRYIDAGHGYVGIHAAADTEYTWPWYGTLLGTWFKRHPQGLHPATIRVEDLAHPSTSFLPTAWQRTDEWYDFQTNPRPQVHVLATLDESTYSGGGMGSDHPIAWCHLVGAGRSWYTGGGHAPQAYDEPLFQRHLVGGIRWAAGAVAGNCS
jgi:type 1 glutamine amidotransferase